MAEYNIIGHVIESILFNTKDRGSANEKSYLFLLAL